MTRQNTAVNIVELNQLFNYRPKALEHETHARISHEGEMQRTIFQVQTLRQKIETLDHVVAFINMKSTADRIPTELTIKGVKF